MNTEQRLLDLLAGNIEAGKLGAGCRRKGARIPQELPLVRIANEEGEYLPIGAQIANLSKFGMGLRTSKPLPLCPGTTLIVEMGSLVITGIVRYCVRRRTGTGPFEIGIEIKSTQLVQ